MRTCRNFTTVFFLMLIFNGDLFGQQNKQSLKVKPKFGSYNSMTMFHGYQSFSAGLQSVNGFEWRGFYSGVGVAIDFYGLRTVPVFADLRKMIHAGRQTFFAYGDIGYHLPWIPDDHGHREISSAYKSRGGLYYDIGIGYLKKFRKNHALVFSGGFTFKEMNERFGYSPCSWPGGDCDLVYETYTYRFNRWVFKAGWRF